MTTEQPARENRPARRSSYGSDLAAPQQQVRQRAHSNDNALRAETSAITNDEVPKMFPWRNDVLPEQPLNQDAEKSRPISQIGFEKLVESTKSDEQTTVYPHATSALLDMPVISPPKRTNSTTIERLEMPTVILDHKPRSRSPSPVDSDVFQRQVTQEQSADISGNYFFVLQTKRKIKLNFVLSFFQIENFARLTLGEINSYLYANEDLTTAKLVSETPIIDQTSSNDNTPHAHHSRDSSPSVKENNSRSTSPTSGYNSSSAHVDRISRDSTASPPSAFVPEHKYLIVSRACLHFIRSYLIFLKAQDSSPKTNNLPSPTIGGKYSTIAALIKPHRPVSQIGTPTNE